MDAPQLRQRAPIVVDAKPANVPASPAVQSDLDDGLEPFTPPNFTIKDLLGAIPQHCFERSAWRSSLYVLFDAVVIGACAYAASFIDSALGSNGYALNGWPGFVAKWAAWNVYWFIVGCAGTGLWVIAHECGHQAFSTSKRVNNAVGLVLHSLLLVPYHSWRISHGRHHAATGHMTRDEVFVPATLSEVKLVPAGERKKAVVNGLELEDLLEDTPIYALLWLLGQQILGWPGYLIKNVSGQAHYPAWTNHFQPSSIIFDKRHRQQVLISDAGLAVVIAGLTYASSVYGFSTVFKFYGVIWFYVHHWLVMITFLQHTDPDLPHYRKGEWNFQRGALCTIDRNMLGFIGPVFMHGICETHVLHHINSKIPHYHAWEATEAIKNRIGPYYMKSDENMFVSLWKNKRQCKYVDDEGETVFYRNTYGMAKRRVVYPSVASDSGVDLN